MSLVGPKSIALQERAQRVLPLGVNSNFRYWGDQMTPYVGRAKGAYLWDVDGKRYIDYRMAFGPIILGHAFDEVDAKVIEEISNGVLFAMTGELEVAVAEMISEMVPAMQEMGVYMTEAWHTAYGEYPIRMVSFVSEEIETIRSGISSRRISRARRS